MSETETQKLLEEVSHHLTTHNFIDTIQTAQKALEVAPNNLFVRYAYAYALTRDKSPEAREKIKSLCREIIEIGDLEYNPIPESDLKTSMQWAYNALAWYRQDEAKDTKDLEEALRLAEIGCGIQFDDTFNEIFNTRVKILLKLTRNEEAYELIRIKLKYSLEYKCFQTYKDDNSYNDWLKKRSSPSAIEALQKFDQVVNQSKYFFYEKVVFSAPLDQKSVDHFQKEFFKLPPSFLALATKHGLPSFTERFQNNDFNAIIAASLEPYEYEGYTDEMIDNYFPDEDEDEDELPEKLAAFQFYRGNSVNDFFVFNYGKRFKSGEIQIGVMFHGESYSPCDFKSYDEHICELVERLITEA